MVLGFVGICGYGYLGDGSLFEDRYEVQDYPEDPPFATVADLAPPGEYRLNHSQFSSGVTVWSNKLVPVNISWCEKADVTTDDGSVFTAALCLEYHEAETEWLAKGIAKERKQEAEEMAQKYRNGEISREEYDQWRYRYPKSEAERNEAARKALKEENNG